MIAPLRPHDDGERADGEARKAAALDAHEARRAAYLLRGRRALLLAALSRGWATADDVRAAVELPAGERPVYLGAVPGPLVRAGIIAADGTDTTTRAVAHARPLTRWRLVNPDGALAWLDDHPDPERGGEQRWLFDADGAEKSPAVAAVGRSEWR
jgi:hypothetical protein